MAGILDYIMAQQGRKDALALEERQRAQVQSLLGRPGVLLEGFDDQPAVRAGGTGLLADPDSVDRQAAFAGGLLGAGIQQGGAMLSGIFSDQAANTGAQTRQRMVNEQSDIESRRTEGGAMRRAELNAQISRLNALDQIAGQQEIEAMRMMTQQEQAQSGPQLGGIQPGFMRRMGENGWPEDVALPGSQPHIQAREILNQQEEALTNIDGFLETFDQVGTEMVGADVATLRQFRQRVISAVAALDNMGVLQAGELERIEESLPDPTTFASKGVRKNSTIRKAYETLRDQYTIKNNMSKENYKNWPGLESFQDAAIPPGFVRQ